MLYEAADAEDKAKMDDYAEFCAYLDEHRPWTRRSWMTRATLLTEWKLYVPF